MKAILSKFYTKNTPRWIVLVIDLYIIITTFVFSYFIRFNFSVSFDYSQLFYQIPLVVTASLITFLLVGSYKGVVRHTGLRDSFNVGMASFIIMVLLLLFVSSNKNYEIFFKSLNISKSIIVIHFLLNVICLITSRFVFKYLYYIIASDFRNKKRVLIYGAGEAGLLTYSVLKDDKKSKFAVMGFIDDDLKKNKLKINRLKVYHSSQINKAFLEEKNISEVILSIQNIKFNKLLAISDKLSLLGVKVKIVPPASSWVDGSLKEKQIKTIRIEDLLGRDTIELNNPILVKEFNDKKVLITGAAGSIGSEIARQIATYKYRKLVLIDQAESELYNLQQYLKNKGFLNIESVVADIRNKKRLKKIIKTHKPQIVFHAAAYKHVPFMEENPYEAVRANVLGTKNIADLASENKAEKFVMISTDKAVNPTNVMGATKRIAEMYISCLNKSSKTKFITTRFGNVLGSNGSVIPLFKAQIKQGGPLTVTHKDITRYFMTIPEACQLVLEAGAMGQGGEIFVFDMGESVKIFELAKKMIRLSGLSYPEEIDIKIVGLRPGEKIYEELLGDGENTIATHHEKIMIAKVRSLKSEDVIQKIEALCEKNKEINSELTVTLMKAIVPEFVSNNSKFAVLDSK